MYLARAHYTFRDNNQAPGPGGPCNCSAVGTACWPEATLRSFSDWTIADLLISCGNTFSFYAEGYAADPQQGQCYPNFYDATDNPFAYYSTLVNDPRYMKDYQQLFADMEGGTLPAVSFVKALGTRCEHPVVSNLTSGQEVSASILSAVLSSPLYANTTLFIVTPDESGGYYDHIPPPPDSTVDHQSYGPRIPLLALGHFAKQNYISHVAMEHSSLVKFIEWNWLGAEGGETGQLNTRDRVVNNIGDLLTNTGTQVPDN